MAEANSTPDNEIAVATHDGPASDTDTLLHIRRRFEVHSTYWNFIHELARTDDQFRAGEQWPTAIREERESEGRPVLTYNLMPSFCRQIINRVRQDRPQIKVAPVEADHGEKSLIANLAGNQDYSTADVLSGIIRNIEHNSRADQAYDTALTGAVERGFGFFYLANEWSKVDPFVQDLVIHRVRDAYSVTLDPNAHEADFRDAQDAFMHTMISRDTFKRKYGPDVAPNEFASPGVGSQYAGWYDGDNIQIAQYYWIDYKDDEVLRLSNGKTVWLSEVKTILDDLKANEGIHVVKMGNGQEMRRKVKRPVCMWQKMTSRDILEGPLELPYSSIPIFPVVGDELMVEGRTVYESAIRHAIDPQRSYNYFRTAAAEAVALAPRAPFIAEFRQIKKHMDKWETANKKNWPVLPYDMVEGAAAPQRQFQTQVAAAELANAGQDAADMQMIIGLHDASLGRDGNEKSGKAILARQTQGATATFQFPDNLSRAIEQMGRLLVEAIPRIYDTDRITRVRMPDGREDFVKLNTEVVDEATGNRIPVHDIAVGKYDVVMDTGPSYQTLKQEAAELQMELLKILTPQQAEAIAHLVVQNLGVPGSDEVAAILRKLLPENLKSEEEKEADLPKGITIGDDGQPVDEEGNPWQPPPTREQELAAKQQEIDELGHKAELAKSEASMAESEADKATAQAKTKTAEATLAKAQNEMQALQSQPAEGQQDQEQLKGLVLQLIAQALEEHEQNQEAHREATEEMVTEGVVEGLKRVQKVIPSANTGDQG